MSTTKRAITKAELAAKQAEGQTLVRVHVIMRDRGGRLLRVMEPNDASDLCIEFWGIGQKVVVIHFCIGGGFSHYIEGSGSLWVDLEQDMDKLKGEML
jgi:hypothetical protein